MNKKIARYFATLISIMLFSFLSMGVFPSALQAAWWSGPKKAENKKPASDQSPAISQDSGISKTNASEKKDEEAGYTVNYDEGGTEEESSSENPAETKPMSNASEKTLSDNGGGGQGSVVRPPVLLVRPPQVTIVPRPPAVATNPNANRPPQQPERAPERPPRAPERPPQNPNNR